MTYYLQDICFQICFAQYGSYVFRGGAFLQRSTGSDVKLPWEILWENPGGDGSGMLML